MNTASSDRTTGTHPNRRVVVWGCKEHQTPSGQECQGCGDQGELFTRADAAGLARKRPVSRPEEITVTTDLGQRCPMCGSGATYWTFSTREGDIWDCGSCGHQWTVAVDEPSSAGAT